MNDEVIILTSDSESATSITNFGIINVILLKTCPIYLGQYKVATLLRRHQEMVTSQF